MIKNKHDEEMVIDAVKIAIDALDNDCCNVSGHLLKKLSKQRHEFRLLLDRIS